MNAASVLTSHQAFLKTLDHPTETQRGVLDEILQHNAQTAYGSEYGLSGVTTPGDYAKAVPIRTHSAFMPWIERTMAGERGVLTTETPVAYFSSSGSTGQEKHIPVTAGYMKRCFLPFYRASFGGLAKTVPGSLADSDGVLDLWRDPGAPQKRTEGGDPHIGPSQLDYRQFGEAEGSGFAGGAGWRNIPAELADADPWERFYLILRLAAEADIRLVLSINPALAAGLSYVLREQWPRMVEEIRQGTLGGLPHREPNPRRADEIAAYAKTFGTVLPYHLWPRLRAIVVWNSALASLYLPRVREAYGPGVRLVPAPIASSEGPVAVPVDGHPSGAPLYVPGCFYEFAPAETPIAEDSETLLAGDLEVGRDYHLVVSHIGGLYRCAVNDVVRVVGRVGATPRIEYTGRDVEREAAGVRLSERGAVRALGDALARTGTDLRNATFEAEGDRFRVALATALPGPLPEDFEGVLDDSLGRIADGYREARGSGTLGPVEVVQVHDDAFFHEWERSLRQGLRRTRVKDRIFHPATGAWARITAEAVSR